MSQSLPDSASKLFTLLHSTYTIQAEIEDIPENKWYRGLRSLLFWLSSPFLVVDILWEGVKGKKQDIQGPFTVNQAHFQLLPLAEEDSLAWYDGPCWILMGEHLPKSWNQSWILGPYVSLRTHLYMMSWSKEDGKIALIAWDTITNTIEAVCLLEACNWYMRAEGAHLVLEYQENPR